MVEIETDLINKHKLFENNAEVTHIAPIETRYKGYRFRSRLEARWAVFFDAVGIQWDYELEGYDLGRFGWYLPDFKLYLETTEHKEYWLEVKPSPPTDIELNKMMYLCSITGTPGGILFGRVHTPGLTENKQYWMKCFKEYPQTEVSFDEYMQTAFEGALIYPFTKMGTPIPNFKTFAFIDGGKIFDVWDYYLLPKDTFNQKIDGKTKVVLWNTHIVCSNNGIDVILPPVNTYFEGDYTGNGVTYNNRILEDAYTAARSARFEKNKDTE